jgi:hypothetical protein
VRLNDGTALRIHRVRLIDGISAEVVDDAVLEADADGRITYAGPAARAPEARVGVRTIDGQGGTLLPGLFDCHTHLGVASDRSLVEAALLTDPIVDVLRTTERLSRTLQSGVTSARDLGGLPAGFRDAVEAGLVAGPRLQTSVGVISHTGGHADGTLPSGKSLGLDYCELADDVVGVRTAARRMLRAGADLVKICTSGGIVVRAADPAARTDLDEVGTGTQHPPRTRRGGPASWPRSGAASARSNTASASMTKAVISSARRGPSSSRPCRPSSSRWTRGRPHRGATRRSFAGTSGPRRTSPRPSRER